MRQGQKCWHNGRRRHPLQWPLSFPPWLFDNNSQVDALDFMVPLHPFKKTHIFCRGSSVPEKHYFTLLPSKWPLPVRRKVTSVRDLQLAAPSSTADPLPATTPQLRCSPAPAVTHYVLVALALAKQWSGPEGPRHLGHCRNRYRSTMKQWCTTL